MTYFPGNQVDKQHRHFVRSGQKCVLIPPTLHNRTDIKSDQERNRNHFAHIIKSDTNQFKPQLSRIGQNVPVQDAQGKIQGHKDGQIFPD